MLVDAPDGTYTHPEDCIEMADAVENGTAPTPFNEALRLALHTAGMSQKELASRTRRSPAAVSQWLHGKDIPAADIVMLIEKHLGLARGTLVYLVECKSHPENGRSATLPEEFNTALFRHPDLDDDQKAMVRDVVERFIKINRALGGSDNSSPSAVPPAE